MKSNMKTNGRGQPGQKQVDVKTTSRNSTTGYSKSNGSKETSAKNSMNVGNGLRELFENSLKDMYWAEKALVKALPKMAKNASSDELVQAIKRHLSVTEQQVTRLEDVFEMLGKTARAKKCEAMSGLIEEGESIIEETEEGVVRDAGIILACQKIEHYEIATYGTLSSFASKLGENKVAGLIELTLKEEKDADKTLTIVAEKSINIEAAEGDMAYEDVKENSGKVY